MIRRTQERIDVCKGIMEALIDSDGSAVKVNDSEGNRIDGSFIASLGKNHGKYIKNVKGRPGYVKLTETGKKAIRLLASIADVEEFIRERLDRYDSFVKEEFQTNAPIADEKTPHMDYEYALNVAAHLGNEDREKLAIKLLTTLENEQIKYTVKKEKKVVSNQKLL